MGRFDVSWDDATCHNCSGGPAKHMAVRPQEQGDTRYLPIAAFLVLDCNQTYEPVGVAGHMGC